jgi:type VI secretion system protein ImpA
MPLRNDLLNPISPDQPAGVNLWYDPVYDEIKKARHEDLLAPAGATEKDRKLADWPVVIKLASDSLAARSKDLQLAVWLAEAMLKREGISGFRESIDLIRGLIENFWECLYPELEDGDAEFRAAPLASLSGERMVLNVKQLPVTKGKITWVQYGGMKKVPREEEVGSDWSKKEERDALIAEGKLPPEEFDKDFNSTPKQWYVDMSAEFDGTLESLAQLAQICDEKFGDQSPSLRDLQNGVDEVRRTIRSLLSDKLEKEPDEAPPEAAGEAAPEPVVEAAPVAVEPSGGAAAAPARARVPAGAIAAVPTSVEDAVARVAAVAKYLREQDPHSPAPYLMLRGLRWGELRASGSYVDQAKLGAPSSEIRTGLKKAALESDWATVLETGETAMAMECGRGWLDLQRYVARAAEALGYDAIRASVLSELKALLADYPQLPEHTMMDDTPTANAETLAWIRELISPQPGPEGSAPQEYQYEYTPQPAVEEPAEGAPPPPPDPFDLALQAARSGRPQDGIELLMREMMQEPSGRGRFQRRIQVAQLCLSIGNEGVALPILQEAAGEIERRRLDEWETRELVAHTLGMLYKCLAKRNGSDEERQRLYAAICRLDPLEAMKLGK